MPVFVRSQKGPHDISLARVRTRARRMLNALGRSDNELSVVLVDDTIIQQLNAQYRDKDRPTDVLSFAMNEGEYGDINPGVLGDVVISIPTARRQALRARRTLLEEVTMLLAHGLLHLLGYDHQTPAEHREMTAETKRLIHAANAVRPLPR